jgi:type II secretory ATPase GspE/PulE/Tfp pilus assembly ATPase PilB-like protein
MIIITGPTGSGKSTTLYAIINRLNNTEKNIITIEDPVEYQMKGITQIQVKPEIGLSFANVLRAVLRQNPDIVMVGEMRDFETVDIAIKSALTGHLILSTLHTNDAPSAIVRLMNMGIEAFLIASTLTLIAAQRLCRRTCPKCKESYEISVADLSGLPLDFKDKAATFYRGKGCGYCSGTGYFGRVAVVEALIIDDQIRQMILRNAPLTEIREYARKQGMRTLREDALEKCLAAEVSLEEALRVTPEG